MGKDPRGWKEHQRNKESVTVTGSLRRGGGGRQDRLSAMAVYEEPKSFK